MGSKSNGKTTGRKSVSRKPKRAAARPMTEAERNRTPLGVVADAGDEWAAADLADFWEAISALDDPGGETAAHARVHAARVRMDERERRRRLWRFRLIRGGLAL